MTPHPDASSSVAVWCVLAVLLAGCGAGADLETAAEPSVVAPPASSTSPTIDPGEGTQRYPDVIAAELSATGGTFTLSATISSPYDSPTRYADAFRAVTPDGTVLGVRELTHDHANEQPFTRSLTGLVIPEGVTEIVVEARDSEFGWGGSTVTVEVVR